MKRVTHKALSAPVNPQRRRLIRLSALAFGAVVAGDMLGLSPAQAAEDNEIRIGYWPIVGGLPLYVAVERGFFKEAGLNVRAVKFASPQQIVEGMITNRIHGCANGTATGALGLGAQTMPELFKFICTNPSNHKWVLDEFLVPLNSPVKSIAELKGKRIATGPGIQNVTLAKIILEKNGFTDTKVIELPVGQHVASLAAGQIDGVYTLEPTGTVGQMRNLARTLETGVISKYVLDDADAPWFGGAAALTSSFINGNADKAKRFIDAYARAVAFIQSQPDAARENIGNFTGIDSALLKAVPLPNFVMYNDMNASDIGFFQKYYDIFTERKIFRDHISVAALMYSA